MAKIEYTINNGKGISGQFGEGATDGLFYAGAFISGMPEKTYDNTNYRGYNTDKWPNKRRFFGYDYKNYAYTYSAGFKLPKGKSFKVTFVLKGQGDYGGYPRSPHNIRCGYTLTQCKAGEEAKQYGDEPTWGYLTNPDGLSGIKTYVIGGGADSSSNVSKWGEGVATVEIIFPDSYSEKTVYVYFWGDEYGSNSLWTFKSLEAIIEYTEYTNVGNSSISSLSSAFVKPSGNFTITINPGSDGTNNPVTGYRIYYSTGTVTTNSNYKYSVPENNQIILSYSDIGSPARGSIINFGIMTIGSASGYNSALVTSSLTIKVNSLPSQPTVTMKESTVPKNGTNYNVVINSINSTDIDSDAQTLTHEYTLTSTTSLIEATWKIVPNDKTINCNNSTMYLSFRAYDGLEYSSVKTIILTQNTGPTNCSINSVIGSGYEGAAGNYYTRSLTLKATGSSDYTYEWLYKYSQGDYISLGKGKELSNKDIQDGLGTIDCRLVVTDKYSDQIVIPQKTLLRYAKNLEDSDIKVTLYNLENCENLNEVIEFSRNMSTRILFTAMGQDKLYVKKIKVKILSKNDQQEIANEILDSGANFNSTSANVEKQYNLNINKVATASLGECYLELSFYASNQNSSELKIYTYTQDVSFIPFFADVFTTSNIEAFLYLNDNNSEEKIIVNAGPETPYQVKDMAVYVQSPIANLRIDISEYTNFTRGAGDAAGELTFHHTQDIFQKLKLPSNQDYELLCYVFPVNIFNEAIVDSKNIADYLVPSSNILKIKFKVLFNSLFVAPGGSAMPYILPHISYPEIKDPERVYPNWSNLEIDEKERMVNYGEYIYLDNHYLIEPQIKVSYDKNGNKIERKDIPYLYTLQYSKLNDSNLPISWMEVDKWTGFSMSGEVLPFDIRELNGERIIFRLGARDEYNLPVLTPDGKEWLVVNSASYLIGCRREQPSIIISDCIARENNSKNNYYATLGIEDYGGNNKEYENFARDIDKISINEGAEGTYKITWRCGEKSDSLVLIEDSKIGRISNLSQSGGDLPRDSIELNLGNLNNLTGRIYVEIEITFYYNINGDYINVKTPIFIVYTEGPTVSYRYHQLGINTNIDTLDGNDNKIYGDDVLTISDFQNKKYIRLKGDYIDGDTTIAREILIDLKNGTVSGLTINCGSW